MNSASQHDGRQTPGAPDRPFVGPADTPLAFPIRCIACGYDLMGLLLGGVCPECGTPVARSANGDLLAYTPATVIRRLERGAALVLGSVAWGVSGLGVLLLAGMITTAAYAGVPDPRPERWIHAGIGVLAVLLVLVSGGRLTRGWRLLLAREGGSEGAAAGVRCWPTTLAALCPALSLVLTVTLAGAMAVWTWAIVSATSRWWDEPVWLWAQGLLAVAGVLLLVLWSCGSARTHALLLRVPLRTRATRAALAGAVMPASLVLLATVVVLQWMGPGVGLLACLLVPVAVGAALYGLSTGLGALLDLCAVLPQIAAMREAIEARAAVEPDGGVDDRS
jgi:hypothetical protein